MITSRRMAAIDRNAIALGIPRRNLMESAGNALSQAVKEVGTPGDVVTIVCGRGDNGGDGFAAARFLSEFEVRVVLVGEPRDFGSEATRENWAALEQATIERSVHSDSSQLEGFDADVLVDGLLGTGVRGRIREPVRSAIEAINRSDGHVISVDVPSGIDPDTGDSQGVAVEADHVVTFHDAKVGLDSLDVPVTVADIGIPRAAHRFVGPGDRLVLDGRDASAHKGDHGRVLVVGGGPYTGAPTLSALAALRAGADLAEVATPSLAAESAAGMSPDLLVTELPGERLTPAHLELLEGSIDRADVLAIGPGLGDHPDTLEAAATLIEADLDTIVVDADALGALPRASPTAEVIATPHAGEFTELGFDRPEDWQHGEELVTEAARELEATVLLKGRYDVISNGERTAVNRTGNPGMTVGGTGDVLTGVTAALAHRGTSIEAAAVAAWVTGRAGDICLEETGFGFLASDLIKAIPAANALEEM